MATMLQAGITPPQGVKMIDVTAFMEDILRASGKKEFNKYFFPVQPPQQAGMGGGGGNPALAGKNQPQIGSANLITQGQEGGTLDRF